MDKIKIMYILLRNPFFIWISWLIHYFKVKKKFKNTEIGLNAYIKNAKLESYVFIGSNSLISNSTIGEHSYVSDNSKLNNVYVGKFTSIGPEVRIGLGKHPINDFVSLHPAFYSKNKKFKCYSDNEYFDEFEKIEIGNDVWIGSRCIVLDGIIIGDGAIIAAGSVVTRNIEPYSIYGGIPAKFIRWRFEKSDAEFLNRIKWWNFEEKWFMKNYKSMHTIAKLKELLKEPSISDRNIYNENDEMWSILNNNLNED